MSYRAQVTATMTTAPPPDDSDFLESEDEQSIVDNQSGEKDEMTEMMEADLAAITTPATSQITSASAHHRMHPMPAGKIMQMTHNFSFTYFRSPAPSADTLNRNRGREAAGLPIDGESRTRYVTRVNPDGSTQSEALPASTIAPHIHENANVHWFCIDSELVYLSFFEDWGPLNVAMFYRFCLHLHHLINSAQEDSTASVNDANELHLILYTSSDAKHKANAALLAAMYAMVCGDVSPADAYHPLNSMELLPFRDAGYGRADYYLTVQDVLYGVNRAISEGLLDLMTFDLEEYETYEQVQNGDWNWITPNIIAFASPNDKEYVAELRDRANGTSRPATPGLRRPMNPSFVRTVQYFKQHNVKLVVRLNNPLYDSRVFEREGIEHVDMYFDDGSNPCEEIVRDFIARADEIISNGGVVAVHCKAGLGRTGVLIGAYLAYRHGFAASESIGFMRIMRPGCVVGPQQHFMYQQAANWMRWREQDEARKQLEQALAKQRSELIGKRRLSDEVSESSATDEATTESEVDASLGGRREDSDLKRKIKKLKKSNDLLPTTPKKTDGPEDYTERRDDTIRHAKPAPCVGQPRKSPSPSRKRAAQAQAPATIARMGGTGTLAEARGRIVSGDHTIRSQAGRVVSSGSASSSSSSESIELSVGPASASALSRPDFIVRAEVQANNHEVASDGQRRMQEEIRGPVSTPSSAQVLSETRRANSHCIDTRTNHKIPSGRLDFSEADSAHNAENIDVHMDMHKAASTNDEDELFIEGWKSPEAPSTYTQRMTQSSPQRGAAVRAQPSTTHAPTSPTSPPTPTASSMQRASPHIRERFGLREAGSNQNTPRGRKEAMGILASSSLSQGSNGSLASDGSLTSRDAAGSADELTPTLTPGPLEKLVTSSQTSQPSIASPIKGQPSAPHTLSSTRQRSDAVPTSVPAGKVPMASISTRSTSQSSASSASRRAVGGTATVSRPGTSMSTRQPNSTSTSTSQQSARNGAPSSTAPNGVRRHVSSVTNSAGRVAAARERLAQKQQGNSSQQQQQRASSLKRQRVNTPDAISQNLNAGGMNGSAANASRAPSRNGLTRPALGSAPSSATNGTVRQTSNGVPRFAMSTAASAAKSNASSGADTANAQKTYHAVVPTTANKVTGVQSIVNRFGSTTNAGGKAQAPMRHHHMTSASNNVATSMALARLHGRNVHRRRSSLGETDIVM